MTLCLFSHANLQAGSVTYEAKLDPLHNRTGDIWHIGFVSLDASLLYGMETCLSITMYLTHSIVLGPLHGSALLASYRHPYCMFACKRLAQSYELFQASGSLGRTKAKMAWMVGTAMMRWVALQAHVYARCLAHDCCVPGSPDVCNQGIFIDLGQLVLIEGESHLGPFCQSHHQPLEVRRDGQGRPLTYNDIIVRLNDAAHLFIPVAATEPCLTNLHAPLSHCDKM